MTPERFRRITDRYAGLTIAVVGDFCLDRYLEIDPARAEVSIETGLTAEDLAPALRPVIAALHARESASTISYPPAWTTPDG